MELKERVTLILDNRGVSVDRDLADYIEFKGWGDVLTSGELTARFVKYGEFEHYRQLVKALNDSE
jgi:hypothetical protein